MRNNFGMMIECLESLRYRTVKSLEYNRLNIDVAEAEALISTLEYVLEVCYSHKCDSASSLYDYSKHILEYIDDYKDGFSNYHTKCDLYLSWCKVLEIANTFMD